MAREPTLAGAAHEPLNGDWNMQYLIDAIAQILASVLPDPIGDDNM